MAKYAPEYSGKDSILSSGYEGVSNWFKGDYYCREHDGSIADFSKLNDTLDDLKNYKEMFERRCTNLKSITAVGAFAFASVAIITPVSWLAAPKLAAWLGSMGLLGAASTGTAISTLHGAALISASLAAIGPGGMAGGNMSLESFGFCRD
jgi:hypothetical protein